MGVTRDRVTIVMALSIFLFGCKGAGGLVKAAVVVGYVAARVAVAAAASSHHHSSASASDDSAPPDPPPAATVAAESPTQLRCVAVEGDQDVDPEQKSYVCGKHVIMLDPQTGRWVEKR